MNIIGEGFTFDDLLLVPQKSEILPAGTDVSTQLTKNIHINVPIVSAAMDTVTDAKLAIAIAREGGIGIIHRAMPIELQVKEVKKVKKSESIIITDPQTLSAENTVGDALQKMEEHKISGFPVVDSDGILIGIITGRDLKFETEPGKKITALMTTGGEKGLIKQVTTSLKDARVEQAKNLMKDHKVEKLPIVDPQGKLIGLVTLKDIEKREKHPNACKDEKGKLRVGAAIGVGEGAIRRAEELMNAGADLIAIDTAHGHSKGVIETLKKLRQLHPDMEIIAGNIATAEAATDLILAGASAIKVGVGPGSICITRIIAGIGVPQMTAISECAKVANNYNIPLIADGGIKYSGDITKALAAGASSVMIGGLFAGTDEAPGENILYQGRLYKVYRGMGSIGAMSQNRESQDRYGQSQSESKKLVPEGVEGRVPHKGPLADSIYQLVGGLRSGLGYCGCKNIQELHQRAQFIRITSAGLHESHVHDVTVTREAPNYSQK